MKLQSLKQQSGIMLLEALIAILIFSLGILSLVALQAASVNLTGEARDRAAASVAVSSLISEMRASRLNAEELNNYFSSAKNGDGYKNWGENVQATMGSLIDLEDNPPSVVVNTESGLKEGTVIVTLFWKSSPSPSAEIRQYKVVAQIR